MPVQRMVFHEITPAAIQRAIDKPRELDRRLVDAQETRRILDRLYGYEVSEVALEEGAAGPVRRPGAERRHPPRGRAGAGAHGASSPPPTGTSTATFAGGTPQTAFGATLVAVDGTPPGHRQGLRRARARSRKATSSCSTRPAPGGLADALDGADFAVRSVEAKPYTRKPVRRRSSPRPSSRRPGASCAVGSAQVMRHGPALYENGYITYMRTDSTTLSEHRASPPPAPRSREQYGPEYLPDAPRTYAKKVKNAQEAHEAIRPAGDRFRTPRGGRAASCEADELRLYELIWQRTVASPDDRRPRARPSPSASAATAADGRDAEFSATGTIITYPGFLRAYVEGSDDPEGDLDDEERDPARPRRGRRASRVAQHRGQGPQDPAAGPLHRGLAGEDAGGARRRPPVDLRLDHRHHPGPRLRVEEGLGPGAVLHRLRRRSRLLEQHFADLVDYAFTARMEDDLDEIASGTAEQVPWLSRFYFGEGGKDGAGIGLQGDGVGPPRRDRRPGRQHHPASARTPTASRDRGPARPLRAVPAAGRGHRVDPRRPAARRAHPRPRPSSSSRPPRATGCSATDPETGLTVLRQDRPLRPLRPARRPRDRRGRGQAQDGLAVPDDDARHPHARRGAAAAVAAPRAWAWIRPTASRSRRRTAATGPYLKKDKDTRSASTDEEQLFTVDLESLPGPAGPAQDAGAGPRPSRR